MTSLSRPPGLLDALVLATTAVALTLAGLALVVVPQKLAQRPASQAVLSLRLDAQGQLWLWNNPVRPQHLPALLRRTAQQHPQARLRLLPDPQVSWGSVQALAQQLRSTPLPLEVQLP